ncbi:hypothetical protein ACFLXU_01115 [Chloroflexota bacterium]
MEAVRLGKIETIVSKLGFEGISIQRDSEDDAVAVVRRSFAKHLPPERFFHQ